MSIQRNRYPGSRFRNKYDGFKWGQGNYPGIWNRHTTEVVIGWNSESLQFFVPLRGDNCF